MSKEHKSPPPPFEFSTNEELFDRISDTRFHDLIGREETTFHEVVVSTNSYGEFLFATLSWKAPTGIQCVTFWGMGYHEYRERWIGREWFYYKSERRDVQDKTVSRDAFMEQFEDRVQFVTPHLDERSQSRRGELFEMLADLTDEDGAYSDLQDLET